MNDVKTRQQIIDKIKASTNILVTVSDSPSVDALSAALGATLALDKIGKHATAIFSGAVPPAITFLDSDKTFEATTDSLRDFIIALDKEKADHLRYKLEGDVVKIFITPYKTTITGDDLEFSQGDYNVELVLALGVDKQEHLDKAMEAHGQILHDATVATVSAGEQVSQLGSIDWHDPQASGLSEMLVSLLDGLKTEGDKEQIIDQQSATALLTGIVAETDRFSNTKTSSKVMAVAAELMAAGADQQLIASKLQESHEIEPDSAVGDDSSENAYGVNTKVATDGEMSISHEGGETLADLDKRVRPDKAASDEKIVAPAPETPKPVMPAADTKIIGAYAVDPTDSEIAAKTEESTGPVEQGHNYVADPGGESQDDTLLKHSYLTTEPENTAPVNSATQASSDTANVDIFSGNQNLPPASVNDPIMPAAEPELAVPPPIAPDFAANLPEPPPLPDFSKLPPPSSLGGNVDNTSGLPQPTPDILGNILNDDQPSAPAVPSTLPTLPPVAPSPTDPGQFQIPGQQ